MPNFFFLLLLFFNTICYSQIDGALTTINNKEPSDIGKEQFTWACVANFTLSDAKNYGRIKFLDTDNKGNVFVVDNNGYLYALSGVDFSEKWKIHLGYEHILNMSASPDGKTLAICYNYIKTATKKLEIRNTQNGRVLLKIKEKPDCYEDSYFVDVVDNTTLYPFNLCYSPDGSKLAVWFKNHGFDENKCIAILEEKLLIINPLSGDILVSRKHIPKDFEWDKCNSKFPFALASALASAFAFYIYSTLYQS